MARRKTTRPRPRNALYAQSGGVTAVINATACGVIEACRKHRNRIGNLYAGRDGIVGALTEDLIDIGRRERGDDPRASPHAIGRIRLGPLQAEGPRARSREVRAPDRGVPRARHRLLLLQRRQRLDGHGAEAQPARRADRLSRRLHRHPEDRGQRPAGHRLLPGFRLGREVRRRVDARGLARRRLDGAHLDPRLHPRSHGPARGLDRGRGRPRRAQGRRPAAPHPVPGNRRSSASASWRASRRRSSRRASASSSPRKARATPTENSFPTWARETLSATCSSAASHRRSPRWSRRRTATSITGRSRITCSDPRATWPRASTSSRPMPSAAPPSSSRSPERMQSCR